MPIVDGKRYPYTQKGRAKAKKAERKVKKKKMNKRKKKY